MIHHLHLLIVPLQLTVGLWIETQRETHRHPQQPAELHKNMRIQVLNYSLMEAIEKEHYLTCLLGRWQFGQGTEMCHLRKHVYNCVSVQNLTRTPIKDSEYMQ